MAAIYVNIEALSQLDFTGEEMKAIKDEISNLYALSHYKEMAQLYANSVDGNASHEDIDAEIAKKSFIDGYMQAVSELTDKYSEIIAKAMVRR